MNVTYSVISAAGPRLVNEDFVDCWIADSGETIACVADGLGGMGGGSIASKLAVTEFRKYLSKYGIGHKVMSDAALFAHNKIRDAQAKEKINNKMATTLTAVALTKKELFGIHCGDSRAVIARSKGIKRLTKDHSEGQRLFEAGKIDKDELATYKRKHILESALGIREELKIDLFDFDLQIGDRIVLTSDGVHNIILLRDLQRLISESATSDVFIANLNDVIQLNGAVDNYSLVALYLD